MHTSSIFFTRRRESSADVLYSTIYLNCCSTTGVPTHTTRPLLIPQQRYNIENVCGDVTFWIRDYIDPMDRRRFRISDHPAGILNPEPDNVSSSSYEKRTSQINCIQHSIFKYIVFHYLFVII